MMMSLPVTCGDEPAEAGMAGGPGLSQGGLGGKTRSFGTENANLGNTNMDSIKKQIFGEHYLSS